MLLPSDYMRGDFVSRKPLWMNRLLILAFTVLTGGNIAGAQEAYKQAGSFNRLAEEAVSRMEKCSDRDSVAIFKAVVDG